MTVRERARISRDLGSKRNIKSLTATSNITGELQVQVVTERGAISVFIPTSASGVQRPVNLLLYATPKQWKESNSFLDAIRLGHLSVQMR